MSPRSFSKLQQTVIALCTDRGHGHSYSIISGSPTLFVKYGNPNLRTEASTQRYLYTLSQDDPRAPRVPKVIDDFSDDHGWAYIVMEYIDAPTLGSWIATAGSAQVQEERTAWAAKQVAVIISWLHACPLPSGSGLGPIGGGIIEHDFFADGESPFGFADIEALQAYVNKALTRAPPPSRKIIDFSKEPIFLCHSDITAENFLIDDARGEIYLIDAQHIQALPMSFASYALHARANRFSSQVAQHIDLRPSSLLHSLAQAATVIQMIGDASLGFDRPVHDDTAAAEAAEAHWSRMAEMNGRAISDSAW